MLLIQEVEGTRKRLKVPCDFLSDNTNKLLLAYLKAGSNFRTRLTNSLRRKVLKLRNTFFNFIHPLLSGSVRQNGL